LNCIMLKERKISIIVSLGVCLLFLASITNSAFAQSSSSPDETVASFYNWYINNDHDVVLKNTAKMKSFVTTRLYLKAKKAQASLDGDFYTNEIAGTTVSPGIVKVLATKTSKSKSIVRVLLKSKKNYDDEPDIVTEIKLKVILVKEKGFWKIDDLEEI
jgi:hypothetical protein